MRTIVRNKAVVALAVLVGVLGWAAPAFAWVSKPALEGSNPQGAPVIPEPSSVILFAAGVAIVGWVKHRRSRNR